MENIQVIPENKKFRIQIIRKTLGRPKTIKSDEELLKESEENNKYDRQIGKPFYKKDRMNNTSEYNHQYYLDNIEKYTGTVCCEVCKLGLSRANIYRHNKTQRHLRNLKAAEPQPQPLII